MQFSSGSLDDAALVSACQADPVLRRWLHRSWLDPRPLLEQSLVRPFVRYLVVDDLLLPERLDELQESYASLSVSPDYPDLNYDAEAVRIDRRTDLVGAELFLHPLWHAWVAFALGASLHRPGHSVVRYRRHPPFSRGFWIHTDRDRRQPKAAAAMLYLGRDWHFRDGGLLQLWEVSPLLHADTPLLRWDDYRERRLSFLEGAHTLQIEAAAIEELVPVQARLLEQIVPRRNRLVLLDFQAGPSYHSITPTQERVREGVVQWLY